MIKNRGWIVKAGCTHIEAAEIKRVATLNEAFILIKKLVRDEYDAFEIEAWWE